MDAESKPLKKLLNRISGQPVSYISKSKYTFGRTLGAGSFGIVRYARDNGSGEDVAVKIILKKALKGNEQIVIDELELLQLLSHPHIVGFRDWFESRDKFYIVTQLATGGELFDRIVQQGRFTEHDASVVIVQMLEAIQYLHARDIVHRDIKPENVLYLNKEPGSNIVLADFGIAKKLQSLDEKLQSSAGLFGYAAPEVIMGTGHGKPCDIWSLGVVTYTILCGYSPFRAENVQDFVAEVRHNNAVIFHADYWKDVSKDARRFIVKALQFNPSLRSTATELLNDPWLLDVASQHRHADLLPNLKQNFDAKGKFRQAIEMVKLANKIKHLKALQEDTDDDPHEINLFGEEGLVSASNCPSSALASEGELREKTTGSVRSPLFRWNMFAQALQDAGGQDRDASKSSLTSMPPVRRATDGATGRGKLATSAFQQLVEVATQNKQRVSEYEEE
ncbi:Pkinase-domain-containing protein [Metschnikowia bicuspidata var. bicuspidata NRRL YB-4993]|uniref:calcium/calmodulin-dependent protein kinase n=1 Tax=Metschnikowia bicuspidata var. bicuspidata NRRL YB-4993 TaxID=869754 RepID=A0A1A0HA25_9ASCO|nr:Pkinase-domain-containing protein [Metschnikowia bicuspidata var. bicuspidata NRRL YB-4993]OBA20727.1 Pkinase-domain-containing protein [Metschnikowia bicuspidata var. bicuspidata NRRL YB-4993]